MKLMILIFMVILLTTVMTPPMTSVMAYVLRKYCPWCRGCWLRRAPSWAIAGAQQRRGLSCRWTKLSASASPTGD